MVEDHTSVAAADKVVVPICVVEFGGERGGFEDVGYVVVAVRCVGLAGCQMTIDETKGGIVDDEADYEGALNDVSIKNEEDSILRTLFP